MDSNITKTTDKKPRIVGADFIRALCAIGILCYHFSIYSNSTVKYFSTYANGDYGGVFVTVFFIMSGFMLSYNNNEIPSIRQYYYKRWKSIFPTFLILFAIFFAARVIKFKAFFFLDGEADRWSLLLSLFGIDGYFLYRIPNYYRIGEWFLGAIVLLYVLYPLLNYCMKKIFYVTLLIVAGLVAFQICTDFWVISTGCNLILCLLKFTIGIVLVRYRQILDRWLTFIISSIVFLVFCFIKMPFWDPYFCNTVMGTALFMSLWFIGSRVMKIKIVNRIFSYLSKISFPFFLLQHIVAVKVLSIRNPEDPWKTLALLIIAILATIVLSAITEFVIRHLVKSRAYKWVEVNVFRIGRPKAEKQTS